MYGSTSDSMNWDSMLDGTLDSLMNNSTEEEEDGNGDQITTGQFPPPSPKGDESSSCTFLEKEKRQMNVMTLQLTSALAELEANHIKCRSSLALCSREIELIGSRSQHWMNRLVALEEEIISIQPKSSQDILPLNHHQDYSSSNKHNETSNNLQSAVTDAGGGLSAAVHNSAGAEGKDIDRYDGDDRRLLASFQGPDDSDILNRIDLLKKHLLVSAADNKAVQHREKGNSSKQQHHFVEHRAKLVPPPPPSSQVEMTSQPTGAAAAILHKRPTSSSSSSTEQFQNSAFSSRTPQQRHQ